MLSNADVLAETGCENIDMTVRKRRILFAGLVARMGNGRLPKRVVLGFLKGGKGYVRGNEQDWMGWLKRDLSLCSFPTEANHWTLAATISGKLYTSA